MKIKAYKKDFDYTYQDDGEIESFLKKQNPFLWMKYWFEQSEYELKRGIVYDEDKLEKVLENPQVIKTPVVRNGKQSTLGYQPDVWKGWN